MYQLFCDSNCELNYLTVKELGLNVIRMPYYIGEEEFFYDMGEKHDFKGFFDKMRAGATPKTMALNEYDYIDYFEPVLERGEDIYYITFSHEMSGTFNQMNKAIDTLITLAKKYRIPLKVFENDFSIDIIKNVNNFYKLVKEEL